MTSISFCIPTRNFGAFIGTTLENLAAQCSPSDEIVIVDGNSTDDTPAVVERFAQRFPRVIYERREINGGVDRDLARAVELATCDYCWLFSADDVLVSGAVDRIRSALAANPAAALVERIDCDLELRPIRVRRWLAAARELSTFHLANNHEMLAYLSRVVSFGGLFSYVSCIIARRSAWQSTEARDALWGTHYAHVGRIFDFLRKPLSPLVYVPMPLVLCRGDNDSFTQDGLVRRFFIDIDGYGRIADELFKLSPDLRHEFLAAVRRGHGLASLTGLRSRLPEHGAWLDACARLKAVGYPRWRLAFAGFFGRYKPVIRFLQYSRRKSWRLSARLRNSFNGQLSHEQ